MAGLNIKLIFLLGFISVVFNQFVVNASPVAYRRDNSTSQEPVSTDLVNNFKLWVQFASAAYCNVTNWDCGKACRGDTTGTRLIKFFSKSKPNDNNGYVAVNDQFKSIIVAYRGTADIQSFIEDIKFLETPFPGVPGAKVHAGFLAVYNDTREEITQIVKDQVAQNPGYNVISVGHSLGGSLALFQTLDLLDTPGLSPDKLMTFTFGQPRTGNDAFAQYVESLPVKIYRLVNKNDIIPHLPPESFEYAHTAPEFWIDPTDQMVECQQLGGDNCSASQPPLNLTILSHAKYFDTAFLLTCLVK
ncbi:7018_t:CDS:2 [Paraglomus occultum]|uniref:7018_t:CDS:1 n=1 Tax=Paraglomus occultum TaxID=144539 RepID=A0A9N9A1H4_9GLOM|nr:7018_t:CDS:2 [Paraglomus occultum]